MQTQQVKGPSRTGNSPWNTRNQTRQSLYHHFHTLGSGTVALPEQLGRHTCARQIAGNKAPTRAHPVSTQSKTSQHTLSQLINETGKQGDSSIQCQSQCEEAETNNQGASAIRKCSAGEGNRREAETQKKGLDPAPTEVNSKVIQLPQSAFQQAATMPSRNKAKFTFQEDKKHDPNIGNHYNINF